MGEYIYVLSAENQNGVNAVQQCSVENQKGAISIGFVQRYSALLVINGTASNMGNAPLALN